MNEPELIKDMHQKKFSFGFYIFLAFFIILLFILFTSFYDINLPNKISGNLLRQDLTQNPEINILAELSPPDNLEIDSSSEKISLKLQAPAQITIGNQHIDLEKDTSLIIDNFEGSFMIGSGKISSLEGKGIQVFIHGIPLTDKEGKKTTLYIDELHYSFARLDNVNIPLFDYYASGMLNVNDKKFIINFKDERFYLENYRGIIQLNKNTMRLEGVANTLDTEKLLNKYSFNSS